MNDERRIFLPVEVCVNTNEIAELLLELGQIVDRLHDIAISLQNHAITYEAFVIFYETFVKVVDMRGGWYYNELIGCATSDERQPDD